MQSGRSRGCFTAGRGIEEHGKHTGLLRIAGADAAGMCGDGMCVSYEEEDTCVSICGNACGWIGSCS